MFLTNGTSSGPRPHEVTSPGGSTLEAVREGAKKRNWQVGGKENQQRPYGNPIRGDYGKQKQAGREREKKTSRIEKHGGQGSGGDAGSCSSFAQAGRRVQTPDIGHQILGELCEPCSGESIRKIADEQNVSVTTNPYQGLAWTPSSPREGEKVPSPRRGLGGETSSLNRSPKNSYEEKSGLRRAESWRSGLWGGERIFGQDRNDTYSSGSMRICPSFQKLLPLGGKPDFEKSLSFQFYVRKGGGLL